MKQYQDNGSGGFVIDGLNIPDDLANRNRRRMQEEIDAGEAEIVPYEDPPDTRTYRQKRAERYAAELGLEPGRWQAVGDVLDELLGWIDAAGVTVSPGLQRILDIRAQIKADIPKELLEKLRG